MSGVATLGQGATTIGLETNGEPGVPPYVQEAHGVVSASADTVTVTENDYWTNATNDTPGPFGHRGFFF
nr:hypothetical protein [uncultured Rhodopila sp.]